MDPPEVTARFREKLGATFTFLSDEKAELLDRLNVRHPKAHKGRDIAFPTALLVDRYGIVRWVYEAELGHMRMTPEDLFAAMERLTLEEQNRELMRGRAVSKVVRQVFLMKRPEDLGQAIDVMRRELRRLGLSFAVCGVAVVDADRGRIRIITAASDGEGGGDVFRSEELAVDDLPQMDQLVESYEKRRVAVLELEPEGTEPSLGEAVSSCCLEPAASPPELSYLVSVPFSHGSLFVGGSNEEGPSQDDVRTLTEFADAISVAYRRFVDFQTLEARTRELQDTQLQLIQSEKMASLGQLVAGVAHELNTPIAAIHSNIQSGNKALERLRARLASSEALEDASAAELVRTLDRMLELNRVSESASRRIAQIVSNLRKFARLDESEWKQADLREGIDECLALLDHEMHGLVEVVKNYEDDLPLVGCYPGQLNQVFMNLLVNAIQSIEGQGTIRIECFRAGAGVSVRIADSGAGIAEEALPRIFDPGYTTKGVGVGTGLGLSIAYRIVQGHGGRIDVRSEKGKGSEFTVWVPLRVSPPAKTPTEVAAYASSLDRQ